MKEGLNPIYRWIAAAIGLVVAVFLVWYFSTVVWYVLIAAVLGLMGNPLVNLIGKVKIGRWSSPKWLAALITLMLMLVTIVVTAQLLIPAVIGQLQQFSSFNVQELTSALEQPLVGIERYINNFLPNNDFSIKAHIEAQIEPLLASGAVENSIASLASWIIHLGIALFSISFISFFFLKDDKMFLNGLVILFPARYEENIRRAVHSSTTLLGHYFIGICIESVIKLICITIPLYFIGFEFNTALVIGIVSAVLNVIPYIGPLIGALVGCIVALLAPVPDVAIGLVLFQMLLVFLIFQLLDNIILQPYIYSSSVKAHPLEIFLVILMAGYMAGVLGMLFAIPAYTVLRVFAKEFFNHFRVVQKLTEKI